MTGTLTGGSRGNRPCLLAKLAELRTAQASLQQHTAELAELERQLGAMEVAAHNYTK